MKLHLGALTAALICTLAGCSQGSSGISGAYLANYQNETDMLQLTESPGGAIIGTMVETTVKPNGTIHGDTLNVSGQVAGSSITLTLREAGLGIFSVNASGTVSGNPITGRSITLVSNGNTGVASSETFKSSDSKVYESDVEKLNALGKTIRANLLAQAKASANEKRVNELNGEVGELNQKLTKYYDDMVTSPRNRELLAKWHDEHEKILSAASHEWQVEQSYPRESGNADAVDGMIDSLQGKLWSVDSTWLSTPDDLRRHVKELDAAVANDPCHAYPSLTNCAVQPAAVSLYEKARPVALKWADDVQTTIKNDNAIMKRIENEAERY